MLRTVIRGWVSYFGLADCDQDGEINIADVTSLIDYLLSGNWSE